MAEPVDAPLPLALMDQLPVGLFSIQKAVFEWCNHTFAAMTELPPEQIAGRGFVDFVAPEDRAFVVDRYRRRLAGEAVPDEYEFSILGMATDRRTPVTMLVRVVEHDGARHSIGVVVDVTARALLAAGLSAHPDAQGPATPVLRVAPGVIVVPLVGRFHAERVHAMRNTVLQEIQRQRAHTLILDVTGLLEGDIRVADYLSRTVQTANLLGARCWLAGVSPALAQVLVGTQGVPASLHTAGTLEDALAAARGDSP